VERVYLDGRVHATLTQAVPLIDADDVHIAGYTGTSVSVAVLDTGIDTNHPDLSDDLVEEQCFCTIFLNNGCCPNGQSTQSGAGAAEDDEGHGTSVSGIITSVGVMADVGVAPDAGIVAVKVLDSDGSGFFSDITAALDWVIANDETLGIRVVNMSLGDGSERNNPAAFPCTGTNLANAIQTLTNDGVAVFVSSGNDGHDDGISYPACVSGAISVGGVYDANVGSVSWCGNASCTQILCTDNPTGPGVFVCRSDSDEILDILAPDWRTDTSALGGGTTAFGGTSAASPFAAGEAALIFDIDGTLTPAQVRDFLKTHGRQVTNPDNDLSFTRSEVRLAPEALGPTQIPALARPGIALFLAILGVMGWRRGQA
jgi:subtilisin family serine protease